MTEQMMSGGRPTAGSAGRSAREQAAHWSRRAEQSHRDYLDAREKARRWRVGAEGEESVARILGAFPLELTVLHDRLLRPGASKVNLDHIVVSHAGVFVLDTKSWSGDLSVSDNTLWLHSDGRRYSRNKELATVGGYADVMAATLRVPVTPLLVLARDHHQSLEPAFVAGVHVVPAQRLREWFLRQAVVMDDIQSGSLLGTCAREFPDATTSPPVVRRQAPDFRRAPFPSTGRSRPVAPRATRHPRPRRRRPASTGRRTGATALIVVMCVLFGPPLAMGFGSVVAAAVTAIATRPTAPLPGPTPSHNSADPPAPPASGRAAQSQSGTTATP